MKYKVGDRVKIKSLDWYNENKTVHGDIWFDNAVFVGGQSLYCGCELTIYLVTNDHYYVIENDYYWTDDMIEGLVEEEIKPIDFTIKAIDTKDKVEVVIPEGYEYVVENDKLYFIKKKKGYPKIYQDCSIINGAEGRISLSIIGKFTKLINARNAYWRIAGQEMGLGKPWEPNWTSFEGYPAIYMYRYQITLSVAKDVHHCLAFPTIEMRDAFYENFKELIEQCKELL